MFKNVLATEQIILVAFVIANRLTLHLFIALLKFNVHVLSVCHCDLSLCYVGETLPPEVGVAWDHRHYFLQCCL